MRVVDMFLHHARETPEREFAVCAQTRLSYGEAEVQVRRVVQALRDSGVRRDDRVAIIGENSVEFVLYYLAAALVGCVPVPLNFRLIGPELAYILDDSEAVLVVADAKFTTVVDEIRDQLPALRQCVVIGAASPGWTTFADWTAVDPAPPASLEPVPGSVPVVQCYTSGTTGHPKGVLMSNDAMAWYALVQGQALVSQGVASGRLLVAAPVFHAGITALWLTSLAWGGCLYIQPRFEPHAAVTALRNEGIAWTLLIPAMIQSCLVDVPDVAEGEYDELRLMIYGGSSISESTLRNAIDVFGCAFLQQYGLTESNAVVNLTPSDHVAALESRPEQLLAAGRPLPGCAVRVVGPDGEVVPAGVSGEILLRGPQLMSGYWHNESATASALRDGWLWTGDAGYLDEWGYLHVRDRIKDMIVTGGENVYSREVEDVLFAHPGLVDAAVIGVPDDRWGEAVKAFVVARQGVEIDPAEVIDFCRQRLAGFKCPKSVELLPSLPRNPSGKVLKRELRTLPSNAVS